MYNDTYFPTNSKHIIKPSADQASCKIDKLVFLEHPTPRIMPTSSSLSEESRSLSLTIKVITCSTLDHCPEVIDLSGKLFFVEFTPEGTLLKHWYLIQVDIPLTCDVNPDYATNNSYWCVSLVRHPLT